MPKHSTSALMYTHKQKTVKCIQVVIGYTIIIHENAHGHISFHTQYLPKKCMTVTEVYCTESTVLRPTVKHYTTNKASTV